MAERLWVVPETASPPAFGKGRSTKRRPGVFYPDDIRIIAMERKPGFMFCYGTDHSRAGIVCRAVFFVCSWRNRPKVQLQPHCIPAKKHVIFPDLLSVQQQNSRTSGKLPLSAGKDHAAAYRITEHMMP